MTRMTKLNLAKEMILVTLPEDDRPKMKDIVQAARMVERILPITEEEKRALIKNIKTQTGAR